MKTERLIGTLILLLQQQTGTAPYLEGYGEDSFCKLSNGRLLVGAPVVADGTTGGAGAVSVQGGAV